MFPIVIGGLAVLLFFWNPIVELVTSEGGARRLPRTSRPVINETLLAIDAANDTAPVCPPDSYVVHIYNKAPLVLYIENFLDESQIEHLLEIRYDSSSTATFSPRPLSHPSSSHFPIARDFPMCIRSALTFHCEL
jgi:prolyl 4-hydroxylase